MKINLKYLQSAVTVGVAVAASALLIACATVSVEPPKKLTVEQMQKRAGERSAERWKALTDKRFSEVFNYLSEASRVGTTAAEYEAAMQRMGYRAAVQLGVECDEILCTVKTNVTLPVHIKNIGARPQTFPIEEQWTAFNGELWLIRR